MKTFRFDVPEFAGRYVFEWHTAGGELYLVTLKAPERDGELPKGEGTLLAKDVGDRQRAVELVAMWRHGFHEGAKNPSLANAILRRDAPGLNTTARLPNDLMSALRGRR